MIFTDIFSEELLSEALPFTSTECVKVKNEYTGNQKICVLYNHDLLSFH